MAYLPIRGVDHYYEWIVAPGRETLSPEQRQDKSVLVFLHGWGGSARYWHGVAGQLVDSFDCLLYDLRGFGRSRLPRSSSPIATDGDYSLESYAEDLCLFLDQLQINRVYLNAHSMGASIATFFLNRYPHRVDRAILTCNGLLEYDEQAFAAFHRFSAYVVQFRPSWLRHLPLVDRLFMARFLHRSLPTADRQAFLEDFLLADYAAALGTARTSVSKYAAEAMPGQYQQLAVPTLLISGEYDRIITADMGKQAAALNDKVEYKVVQNTGHFPMLEDPETYLNYVRTFLVSG